MFNIVFRRLYYVGDKIIVRNLRSRKVSEANPGLQKRIDSFRRQGLKIEDEDAEEFVETSASDFYNVGEAYNAHLNDTLAGKLEKRHHIVKVKYFKENMPNLLTWSEKEQIRHLAQTQSDEWTPEKISESFPVTVQVVKKLLKYPWKPASKERIARHDESAMRNWRELKEGHLDIPEDLIQHFLKFSDRTIPPLNHKSIKIDITQEEKIGEFERIIRKCAAKDEQTDESESTTQETSLQTNMEESKQKPAKRDYKRITLDELAGKIQKRFDTGKDININDTIMLNTMNSKTENSIQPPQELKDIELVDEENKASDLAHLKEQESKLQIDYTQRIRIPKKAYKKGATYKVNDCYYDDDGKFLYRVLGMTN